MSESTDEPRAPSSVLLVARSGADLQDLGAALTPRHQVQCVKRGMQCLALASGPNPPDLIVLDTFLCDMDGAALCRMLLADAPAGTLTVLIWRDATDSACLDRLLAAGAADVIDRPLHPVLAAARIEAHLSLQRQRARALAVPPSQPPLAGQGVQTADAIVLAMASLAEPADVDTGNHIHRTQAYVHALARQLCQYPPFTQSLGPHQIDLLLKATPLHDIGNVGIPDRILLKPGRLSASELAVMKTHTLLGRDAIDRIDHALQGGLPFLAVARQIALSHHERWDGSGYPEGLAGEQIPLAARLMAVADVYDALISRRVYKEGLSHSAAVDIIVQNRASHFDPDLVDAFVEIADAFAAIAQQFADTEHDLQRKIDYMVNAIAEDS